MFLYRLIRIPGSLAEYAPGRETVDGDAVPVPPETLICAHSCCGFCQSSVFLMGTYYLRRTGRLLMSRLCVS